MIRILTKKLEKRLIKKGHAEYESALVEEITNGGIFPLLRAAGWSGGQYEEQRLINMVLKRYTERTA
jgi:hypothetical protein